MSLIDLANQDGKVWSRIGDCYGVTKKPRDLNIRAHTTVPFIPMDSIPQDGSYEPPLTDKPSNLLTSGTYFERGDVLISKITPSFENGKQALVRTLPLPFGYATTEVIPLHALNDSDPRLLFFYLLHPDIRHYVAERMEGSTGRQRVPEGVLLDLPMPLFPATDQKKISDALEAVQAAIALENKSLKNTTELKQSAMRELFTKGLRGEAQKDTAIGPVPESWDVVTIGDVALNTQYGLSVRGQPHGQYPILRMNCQDGGKVVFRDLQYVDLNEKDFSAFRVNDGDLLFNRTNSIEHVGRMAIFEGEQDAVFASYLVRLTVDANKCLPHFLNYYMNRAEVQRDIKRLASRAVGQANINATKLRTIAFPLPPTPDEQREITAILSAIDRKIDLHRQKHAVLEELFQSLLHKLMTGEIRVSELDLSALSSGEAA